MIKLTVHVERRILERHLRSEWIEATISSPDFVGQDADPALTQSFKAIPEFGGRFLKVVHRSVGSDILVVTAHFDRRIMR